MCFWRPVYSNNVAYWQKKGKRKVQGVAHLQAQTPKEEETDKTKQGTIEQTYEEH